jgi:hypothetical protein
MHKLKHLMKEAATNKPDKLAELLMEEIKEVNANFMYELDVLVNGEYMDWCLAKEAVEDMLHDNGKTGERFSKDTTNSHAKRFGFHEDEEADFYFVMNMMYSDYCLIVGEDENRYAEFAKKFIKDKDGPKGKAKKYYYAMM